MATATKAAVSVEERQRIISDSIRGIPDFPKPGILFWDVTTLMLNPTAFQLTIDALCERYKDQKVDVVAGGRLLCCGDGGKICIQGSAAGVHNVFRSWTCCTCITRSGSAVRLRLQTFRG
jgi:hypothetical protein